MMITGCNIHDAWRAAHPEGWHSRWDVLSTSEQEKYARMEISLEVRSGICPVCGSIPAEGLQDIDGHLRCGHDCPGADSGKYCDQRSVGALIRNEKGHILLFHRKWYQFFVDEMGYKA